MNDNDVVLAEQWHISVYAGSDLAVDLLRAHLEWVERALMASVDSLNQELSGVQLRLSQ